MAICMKEKYLVGNVESVFVKISKRTTLNRVDKYKKIPVEHGLHDLADTCRKATSSSIADVVFYTTLVINSQ